MNKTPVSKAVIHKRGVNPKTATSSPKSQKRGNIFFKSHDSREDGGVRQMKTTHNSQTLFRICASL
jgi:hypothetical protein